MCRTYLFGKFRPLLSTAHPGYSRGCAFRARVFPDGGSDELTRVAEYVGDGERRALALGIYTYLLSG